MDLTKLQAERNIWVAQNFPGDDMPNSLLGAVEEVGELSHHYLKMRQGIRGDKKMHLDEMADAVGDIIIYLAGVATYLQLDYGQMVEEVWNRVKQRDWNKNKTDGSAT